MDTQSEQLRTLVEKQSRRIQELEQSLQAMTEKFVRKGKVYSSCS